MTEPVPFHSADDPQPDAPNEKTQAEEAQAHQAELDAAAELLAETKAQVDQAKAELDKLNSDITDARAELADTRAAVERAQVELDDGEVAAAPPAAAEGPDGLRRLVVQDGETLEDVSRREGVAVPALYTVNRPVIEAAAQSRGFVGSGEGRLLFGGTTLTLP